jgi:uncharacterized protein YkwD
MKLGVFLLAIVVSGFSAAQQRSVATQPNAPEGTSGPSQAFAGDAEDQLIRMLNQERTKRGMQPLAMDERLRNAARQHSLRMADKHLLSHGFSGEPELPQRLASSGIRFDRSGENVAFGSSVQQVQQGLMKSPPHRENMLSPDFGAVGVGVVLRDGLLWVTQDFARRLEFRTAGQEENLLAGKFEEARRAAGRKPARRERIRGMERAACAMAEEGKLDTSSARSRFGGRAGAAAYMGADLSELPSAWRKVAQMPALNRYAVGVCFRESQQFPSGGYWAVLVFE